VTRHRESVSALVSRARAHWVLEVADAAFAEQGYHATPMDEIAERAGVSKPSLYRLFGSKALLYAACIERAGEELVTRLSEARSGRSPEDILSAEIAAYFDFVAERRDSWRVLQREGQALDGPVADAVSQLRARLISMLAEFLAAQRSASGLQALPEGTFERAALAIVGACESLAAGRTEHPAVPSGQLATELLAIIAPGIARLTARQAPGT